MIRFLISLQILLLPILLLSNPVDSLKNILANPDVEAVEKLKAYNLLSKSYTLTSLDSANAFNLKAIELAEALPPSKETIRTFLAKASLANARYKSSEAQKAAERALKLCRDLKDEIQEPNALKELGLALKNATKYDSAKVVIKQAIQLSAKTGGLAIQSSSENAMAQIFGRLQQYDSSLIHYRASIALGRKAGQKKEVLAPLYNMGIIYFKLGKLDSCRNIMLRIIDQARNQDARQIQGVAHSVVANIYSNEGKVDSALVHIERGIAISDSLSVERMYGYYNLADIYMKEGELETSLGYWKLALGQAVGVNSIAQADMLKGIGELFLRKDKLDSAIVYLDKSEAVAKKFGSAESLGQLRLLRARALGQQGKYREAISTIGPALTAKENDIVQQANLRKGFFHQQLKEYKLAKTNLLQGLELAIEKKQAEPIASAYYYLAFCDSALGNTSQALKYKSLYAANEVARLRERYKESVAEYETKFETSQKEAQIKSLEQDKRIQDLEIAQTTAQRNTLLGIALVLLMAGLAIFALFVRIRQQREELAKANATKDRLFSIISHDLRGPVTGLQTAGKIFTHHIEKGNLEVLKAISLQVDQQAGRVRNLLDNLLTWSLQQLGVYESREEKFHFQTFGKEVLSYYQQAAQAKGIQMTLDADPGLQIEADRRGLNIILTNLINNAVKYTNEGEIRLSAQKDGDRTRITVKDSGLGMPQEKLDLLQKGEILSSERGTAGEQGTGLGWQIIHELVNRWGGKIRVNSNLGIGTEIDLFI
ncbi:MAG: ATP-binding protein [Bacteroidia bacterium]|nr:ATP-binding protein [Bacteroidia bacterium]